MATPTGWKESRGQLYTRRNPDTALLELPDAGFARYMIDNLFEVGPMTGEHSLSWAEIDRWATRTGVELSEFEAVTLVDLSREFSRMLNLAREPEYLCPNTDAAARSKPSKADRDAKAAAAYARAFEKGD
jgi:hypothetical protein